MTIGPFTAYTQVDTEDHYVFANPFAKSWVDENCDAGPKELKKMTVWAANVVDGAEFQYEEQHFFRAIVLEFPSVDFRVRTEALAQAIMVVVAVNIS